MNEIMIHYPHENQFIFSFVVVRPSVEGVRNVFSSCAKSGSVKRVVHTSSIAAVMRVNEPAGHTFDESDYNTFSTVENGDAYGLAKRVAEQAAFKLASESGSFDCVAINPSVVLGECLSRAHTKATPVILRQCLYGNPVQDFCGNYVDVRDVAEAHVQALRRDVGGRRFIVTSDAPPCFVSQLADPAQRLFPNYELNTRPSISPWAWWALSWVSVVPVVGPMVLPPAQRMSVEKTFYFKNTQAKKDLGITFHTLDDMYVLNIPVL